MVKCKSRILVAYLLKNCNKAFNTSKPKAKDLFYIPWHLVLGTLIFRENSATSPSAKKKILGFVSKGNHVFDKISMFQA